MRVMSLAVRLDVSTKPTFMPAAFLAATMPGSSALYWATFVGLIPAVLPSRDGGTPATRTWASGACALMVSSSCFMSAAIFAPESVLASLLPGLSRITAGLVAGMLAGILALSPTVWLAL